ncbi:hypothetical protein AGMMS50268_16860 [Spirochaetia bacterium]|nr:hypothetical protein AGMMS50268_16860 [Spirochaetia bacterium]
MKEVIKILEEAEGYITPLMGMDRDFCKMAASRIHKAIGILENPRCLTLTEWEEENGKPLPGNALVWWRQGKDEPWVSGRYIGVKEFFAQTYCDGSHPKPAEILVAALPPPENWRKSE